MPAVLRVVLGRLLGALIAGVVAWLAGKGIEIDQQTIDAAIAFLLTVFTIVYSLIHTAINAHINPKDVSSPAVAERSQDGSN